VRVIGIRQTIQRFNVSDGDAYYILELDDSTDVLPVRLSDSFYQRHQRTILSHDPFIIEGRMVLVSNIRAVLLDAKNIESL
jgi:DNA polymerase III alpha subunit